MVPRQHKNPSLQGLWPRSPHAFGCTANQSTNSEAHTLGGQSLRALSGSEPAKLSVKTPQTTVFLAGTTGPEELTRKPELDNQVPQQYITATVLDGTSELARRSSPMSPVDTKVLRTHKLI